MTAHPELLRAEGVEVLLHPLREVREKPRLEGLLG